LKKAKGGFPVPNQEERLKTLFANLKQVQTETVKSYGEMAVELTMVKGLAEDAVKRLASLKVQIEHRFERVDSRLDGMDGRLGRLETLLMQVLARLPNTP
jgi:hypothetical protein